MYENIQNQLLNNSIANDLFKSKLEGFKRYKPQKDLNPYSKA